MVVESHTHASTHRRDPVMSQRRIAVPVNDEVVVVFRRHLVECKIPVLSVGVFDALVMVAAQPPGILVGRVAGNSWRQDKIRVGVGRQTLQCAIHERTGVVSVIGDSVLVHQGLFARHGVDL